MMQKNTSQISAKVKASDRGSKVTHISILELHDIDNICAASLDPISSTECQQQLDIISVDNNRECFVKEFFIGHVITNAYPAKDVVSCL
jgi:hypothetical protein